MGKADFCGIFSRVEKCRVSILSMSDGECLLTGLTLKKGGFFLFSCSPEIISFFPHFPDIVKGDMWLFEPSIDFLSLVICWEIICLTDC